MDRIKVSVHGTGASLTSNLKAQRGAVGQRNQLGAAIDGFESLVMACAAAGVDIDAPEFVYAMQNSLEAIDNHFGD